MEDCQRCQELLGLYIDSMLEGEELSFVESHLLQCQSCKKEEEGLKELLSLLPELEEEPPDDFKQGWRKAIREQKKPKKNYIATISLLAAGAAIVFLSTKMLPSIINPQLPAPSVQTETITKEDINSKEAILSEQDKPALFSAQPQIDALENQDEVIIQNEANEIPEAIIADNDTAPKQQSEPFIASTLRKATMYVSEMSIYVSNENSTAAKEILKELINQLLIEDIMLEEQANELSRLLEEKGYASAFTLISDSPERTRYFISNKKTK